MLKIKRENNMCSAFISDNINTDNVLIIETKTESELKKLLFDKGFDQREIEEAFQESSPEYFSVGKW